MQARGLRGDATRSHPSVLVQVQAAEPQALEAGRSRQGPKCRAARIVHRTGPACPLRAEEPRRQLFGPQRGRRVPCQRLRGQRQQIRLRRLAGAHGLVPCPGRPPEAPQQRGVGGIVGRRLALGRQGSPLHLVDEVQQRLPPPEHAERKAGQGVRAARRAGSSELPPLRLARRSALRGRQADDGVRVGAAEAERSHHAAALVRAAAAERVLGGGWHELRRKREAGALRVGHVRVQRPEMHEGMTRDSCRLL
mmetsp:Transcript_92919/g.298980  ORF Transcript_92919/g.298980 Transcript_92919/m.298980 type:complete len:251 (+) Transcript_92919:111-863(+)